MTQQQPLQNHAGEISAEDALRADLYGLLATLLSTPPSQSTLDQSASLTGDDSDLGKGVTALARLAKTMSPPSIDKEFNALFIGLGRGELLPYGSYYLTGFLNEKPLAHLRGHMDKLGIKRADDVKEPEDHIATLCEIMAGLIRGEFGEPLSIADQHAFFNTHIATWADHFFSDLEGATGSVFYAPVGTIGRAFMAIEIEAFRMDPSANENTPNDEGGA